MKNFSKKNTLFALLFIALASFCLFAISQKLSSVGAKSLPPEFRRPDYMLVKTGKPWKDQKRLIKIGNREFNIPLAYIERGPDTNDPSEGVLLKVIWPDLKSLYDLKNHSEYEQMWNARRLGNILVEGIRLTPAQQIANSIKYAPKIVSIGLDQSGLFKYEVYEYKAGSKSGGRKGILELYQYRYIEKDKKENVLSYIECAPLTEFIITPTCKDTFLNEGVMYQLVYDKQFFLNWRNVRQSAIAFMRKYEVNP